LDDGVVKEIFFLLVIACVKEYQVFVRLLSIQSNMGWNHRHVFIRKVFVCQSVIRKCCKRDLQVSSILAQVAAGRKFSAVQNLKLVSRSMVAVYSKIEENRMCNDVSTSHR